MIKKTKFSLVLLFFIFFILIINFFPISNVLATSDITYNFEYDNFANSTSLTEYDNFNIRTQTIFNFTENYNGSFSFTNEVDGVTPKGWQIAGPSGTGINVTSGIFGHNKVLRTFDTNGAGAGINKHVFEGGAVASGTIEYWFLTDDATDRNYFSLKGNSGVDYRAQVYCESDEWHYSDGSPTGTGITINDDTWNHVRIDFECGAGGYMGLSADTWNLYINGRVISGLSMPTAGNDCDEAWLQTSTPDQNMYGYYDGIYFSWYSNCSLGGNLYPLYDSVETINEVNKWEFAFSDFEVPYSIGSDVFDDWTEIDDGDDDVNIIYDPLFNSDKMIFIEHYAPDPTDLGIEREFDIEFSQFLNVTWRVNFTELPASLSEFTTLIYSYDDTLIADIYFEDPIGFATNSPYTVHNNSIATGEIYDINVFINYDCDVGTIKYIIDDTFEYTYIFNLIAKDKDGLGKIKIFSDSTVGGDCVVSIDNVGVYVNGSSLTTNFGYNNYYPISSPATTTLNLLEHNVFSFDTFGNTSIAVSKHSGYIKGFSGVTELTPLDIYNGSYIVNCYTNEQIFNGVRLWSFFYNYYNTSIQNNFSSFSLDRIRATDGTNYYSFEYENANIVNHESFFYLDTNNYLNYELTMDDNNTEYIQASFDIPDFTDDNYSIRYTGFETGNGLGYVGIEYSDTTNSFFPISSGYGTTSYILNTEKDIDKVLILLTDNDNFDSGRSTGIIQYIRFLYIINLDLSITSIEFLDAILILLVLLVPTLLVFEATKRKAVIVPMLIAMSLIAFATALIPAWLFLILIFSFGGFFFLKYKRGDFSK